MNQALRGSRQLCGESHPRKVWAISVADGFQPEKHILVMGPYILHFPRGLPGKFSVILLWLQPDYRNTDGNKHFSKFNEI